MAIRVEKAFGPKADHFMRIQFAFDEARARAGEKKIRVKRVQRGPLNETDARNAEK